MITVYIGNKNYSSWSLRIWVLMRALDIPFKEVVARFDGFDHDSTFKTTMRELHPTASVPVLENNGVIIADTLAIAEYLAEEFPEKGVWPSDKSARYQARILASAMHSGFGALRHHCIMNIEADLPDVGKMLMRDQASVCDDIDCLHALLEPHLSDDGFLFGDYSAVDAFYAPVMSRIKTYHLSISQKMARYCDQILKSASFQAWQNDALLEHDFLNFEEPYRTSRSV